MTACSNPPSQDQESVIESVNRFFTALANKDSAMAQTVMMPEGRFYSVREDGSIRTQPHAQFFERIATETSDFLERMWDPTVLIQDRIAVVWAPYDFHIGGQFSHCGVDAFSLLKTEDGWKIAGTIYTVQKEGCTPSPLGSPKSTATINGGL
jgi:hypothetical protein